MSGSWGKSKSVVLCMGLVLAFVAGVVPAQARVSNDAGARASSRPAIVVSIDSPLPGQTFQVTSRLGARTVRPVQLQTRVDGGWAKVKRARTNRRGVARFSWRTHEPQARVRIHAPRVRRDGKVLLATTSRATTITTREQPIPTPTSTPTPTATPTPTPTPTTTPTPTPAPQEASFTAHRDAQDQVGVVITTNASSPRRVALLQAQAPGQPWRTVASGTLGPEPVTGLTGLVPASEVRGQQLRIRLAAYQGLDEYDTAALVPPTVALDASLTDDVHRLSASTTGQVDRVRFFVDGVMLHEDAAAPWSFETPLASGRHDVMARALGPVESRLTGAIEIVSPTPAVQPDTGMAEGFRLETVQSGFDLPTSAATADSGLVFVTEKSGLVKAISSDGEGGWELPREVLDLRDLVYDIGDAGMAGLAVDPAFAENGFVYVSYALDEGTTEMEWKSQQVVRYQWDGAELSQDSRHVVLGSVTGAACHDPENQRTPDCMPLFGAAHTVGDLAFDEAGNLLVGVGDSSLYPSPDGIGTRTLTMRVQDPEVLVGKLLRVDPATGRGVLGNPLFVGDGSSNASRVLALGFRNPFRFTVDGDHVIVGDVGEAAVEEIDVVHLDQEPGAPANYGWPCLEGNGETALQGIDDPDSPWHPCLQIRADGTEAPVHHYSHTSGGGSVTAGLFLDGAGYPESVRGQFLYGDYAQNHLRTVALPDGGEGTPGPTIADSTAAGGPVRIFAGPNGWAWTVSIYGGALQQLTYSDEAMIEVCSTGEFRRAFHDLDGPDSTFDQEYPEGPYKWLTPYVDTSLPEEVLAAPECVGDVDLEETDGSPWATEAAPDLRPHPGDRFGVSWRGRVRLEGGTYRFKVRGSEWMRLRVDDVPLHDFYSNDFWGDDRQHDLVLETGLHTVRVEYLHGDESLAYAGVTWERIGGPPTVSLVTPDNGAVTDGAVAWEVIVSDPDGDSQEDLVAGTRLVAEFLHYDGGAYHVHPYRQVDGELSGTLPVDDVHAPGSGLIRLRATTTDASGAKSRSAPVYVCFPGGRVGPCAE